MSTPASVQSQSITTATTHCRLIRVLLSLALFLIGVASIV